MNFNCLNFHVKHCFYLNYRFLWFTNSFQRRMGRHETSPSRTHDKPSALRHHPSQLHPTGMQHVFRMRWSYAVDARFSHGEQKFQRIFDYLIGRSSNALSSFRILMAGTISAIISLWEVMARLMKAEDGLLSEHTHLCTIIGALGYVLLVIGQVSSIFFFFIYILFF